MKTLLHISPLAMQAGCEMNCLRIIQALPDRTHQVLVLDGEGPMTAIWRAAGAEVIHLHALRRNRWAFYRCLQRFFQTLPVPPDGMIYWSTTRLPMLLSAARLARAPLVAHVGNPNTQSAVSSAWAQLQSLVLGAPSGARLVACSEHVRASLGPGTYLGQFPVEVVPNPAELPAHRHEVRELGRDAAIRLGMVARIDRIKDHATVLHALRILRETFPEILLEFAGDGELRPQMEQLARALGVQDNVRFLGHVTEISRLTAGWDVFLNSTTPQEGLGVAVIEAQAVGLPCIVSDLPMMREVGGEEGGCLYFPPGDAAALARVTAGLIGDAAQRRLLGEQGRRRVGEVFAPTRIARDYLRVLDQSALQ